MVISLLDNIKIWNGLLLESIRIVPAPWNLAVIALTEEGTRVKLDINIAKSLSRFIKNSVTAMKNPKVYDFLSEITLDPTPLDHHLLDIGTAKFLHCLWKYGNKKDLMDNEDPIKGWFGDIKKGK